MFQYDEPLDSESFKVEHITLHPEFRYMLTQPDRYDLALLKLDHPVYYRENIIPICLPDMDYKLEGKVGIQVLLQIFIASKSKILMRN